MIIKAIVSFVAAGLWIGRSTLLAECLDSKKAYIFLQPGIEK
ncbi:MAG TPA: hypothetical protein VK469_05400 [Candidatus Kapabacteria bacterium]|nr:hypothetical protein [Candidatus Kapabacteria bacterium]